MAQRKAQRISRKDADQTTEHSPDRPDVIVEFLFDRGLFFISVNNIGSQPALGVSVKFDKKLAGLGGTKEVSALRIFKGIDFLGPKREIVVFLDSSDSYFQSKQPTKLVARVSYTDREKRKYEATINHDLEIYRELTYVVSAPSDKTDSGCAH
jgi:hypothetical protein